MFNLATWLKESMISGVTKGQVSLAYVAIKSEDYLSRGVFTEGDVQEIAEKAIEPEILPEIQPTGEEPEPIEGDVIG